MIHFLPYLPWGVSIRSIVCVIYVPDSLILFSSEERAQASASLVVRRISKSRVHTIPMPGSKVFEYRVKFFSTEADKKVNLDQVSQHLCRQAFHMQEERFFSYENFVGT